MNRRMTREMKCLTLAATFSCSLFFTSATTLARDNSTVEKPYVFRITLMDHANRTSPSITFTVGREGKHGIVNLNDKAWADKAARIIIEIGDQWDGHMLKLRDDAGSDEAGHGSIVLRPGDHNLNHKGDFADRAAELVVVHE